MTGTLLLGWLCDEELVIGEQVMGNLSLKKNLRSLRWLSLWCIWR